MTDEEKALTDIRDKQLMKPKVLIIAPFRWASQQEIRIDAKTK